ncbi:ankyrin repeat and SOCS box protein 5b isoform X4 [Danio rerio]|uniref:Ankyrin repeat and SOCS box protein 5b isoform X4 n=1 Tax=Danio rerio TaxID=7955 RepID=A0A8M9QAL2_DANRE|nr:ankyrin repeat and SOCS box protein 5 isoform X4 [Danio rerio]|eukprot:XP_021330425.1 ankyrin repeat and SOCS box protein 5 isoform X4 [Danio rerio]
MPEVPCREPEHSDNTARKRKREDVDEFSAKKKSRWGVLISQGSWADRSPLHEAACQGRLLALKTLLSQVNATTIDGVTPLFNACSAGSVTCAEVLLEHGAKPQGEVCQPSPIHEASSKGRAACIDSLISWGADVDFDIPHLGTPLYIACASQQLQCAQKLLDGGANVQKGHFLDTPLHAAAQKDSPEIIKVLLEFGASINARNLELQKPVETAPPSSTAEAVLLLYEATPQSLCQLCRLSIRNYMGRSRLHLIPHLKLPTLLKSFLQYR